MTRLPSGYPGPWTEADGGGAADLQTDVMRFMAILAFCLVAIFALVQAIPVESPRHATPVPVAERPARAPAKPPAAAPPALVADLPPAPAKPAAEPPAPASPAPAAEPPVTPAVTRMETGFTLRFESDEALKALVARDEVGLYALEGDEARRLHIANGRLEFWKASTPRQFHEMDPVTVPGDVADALARTGRVEAVRWGVTLPPRLARDIDRRIGTGGAGELVIAANGALRQE